MTVLEAVVPFTHTAREWHQFFLFAVLERTSVGVDLFLLRFAKLVNVGSDGHVRGNIPGGGNRIAAQRTDRNLDVLLVRRMAGMCLVAEVLRTENLPTSVAFHRQEIELAAILLRTMFTQMRKFHYAAVLPLISQFLLLGRLTPTHSGLHDTN